MRTRSMARIENKLAAPAPEEEVELEFVEKSKEAEAPIEESINTRIWNHLKSLPSITVPQAAEEINDKIVLIFDVESTGLFYKNMPVAEYPYITQISMIVYEANTKTVLRTHNSYVRLPVDVRIPESVTKITHITNEICETRGENVLDVLRTFYEEYQQADIVVAHNIEYDSRMILTEFRRNSHVLDKTLQWRKLFSYGGGCPRFFCTMNESKAVCNITAISSNGEPYKKFPKLSETFRHLFMAEELPENLHDSMVDTLVCLRCFGELYYYEDLVETSPDVRELYTRHIDICTRTRTGYV